MPWPRPIKRWPPCKSGGKTTSPNLFYNNARRQVGLVGFWDVVGFDEVGGMKVTDEFRLLADINRLSLDLALHAPLHVNVASSDVCPDISSRGNREKVSTGLDGAFHLTFDDERFLAVDVALDHNRLPNNSSHG